MQLERRRFVLRYLAYVGMLNLVWEFAQLPLYTLWQTESARSVAFAAIHCTAGDILIAASALFCGFLIFGNSRWPFERYIAVAAAAVALGFAYTGFSEWLNVYVRNSWAYSDLMPLVPGLNVGLAPVLQWLVIPSLAFAALRPG